MATIAQVTPQAIRNELRRLGFEPIAQSRGGVTWRSAVDDRAPTVLVPRDTDVVLSGYDESLRSALDRLAWVTGEPAAAIAERLAARGDRLELRIVHQLTTRNSLRAVDAPKVVRGFVDVIKNGARFEFTGPRVHHRGSGGDDYALALDAIELLAPAPGSFKLVAVVSAEPQLTMDDSAPTTLATQAFVSALRALQTLAAENRAADELEERDVTNLIAGGVSLQLVNAVQELSLGKSAGLVLEFAGVWDSELGPRTNLPRKAVALRDQHVSLARNLKPILQGREPEPDTQLTGWVTTSHADELARQGHPSGWV
jgi:hypothetical protein